LIAKENRKRVRLFARGAPRYPGAYGLIRLGVLDQGRNGLGAQGFPGSRIAKETGDRDQQVIEQRLHFLGTILEKSEVVVERGAVIQLHPAGEWAQDRGAVVSAEVVVGTQTPRIKGALERELVLSADAGVARRRREKRGELFLVLHQLAQTCGDFPDRQHQVGNLR